MAVAYRRANLHVQEKERVDGVRHSEWPHNAFASTPVEVAMDPQHSVVLLLPRVLLQCLQLGRTSLHNSGSGDWVS